MPLSCGVSICGRWRVEIAETIAFTSFRLLDPRRTEVVGDLRIGGLIYSSHQGN
jgi:hypothetical protein